jgi:hypothetical protein
LPQWPAGRTSTQVKGRRDAHYDLKISPEIFDVVTAELAAALDDFKRARTREERSLGAFGAEKGEVTACSQPGAVHWATWIEPRVIATELDHGHPRRGASRAAGVHLHPSGIETRPFG